MKQGIIFSSLSTIIFVIVGYIINIWLGRRLGPEAYGIYGVVITLLTTINLFQTSGLPQATSKFIASNEDKENEILKSSLTLQIISTLIITVLYILLAKPIALLLNDLSLVPYLQLSSLIFPFYGLFALYSGFYNGMHQFKRQAIINIAYSIAKLISVISFAYLFKLSGAIAGFIAAPIVALLFGFKLPKKSDLHYSFKKLIMFSIPLILFAFFITLQQSSDLFFVKALLVDKKLTGYYAANQNISVIPFYALSAFSVVLFPSISKSISEKTHEKTSQIIAQSIRYILLILLPLTFIFSATSEDIIKLLFSNNYLQGSSSLSILMFSLAFLTVYSILANILNGAGLPYKTAIISAMGIAVSFTFCYVLIPVYGLNGAALSTGIGSFVAMVIAGILVYKRFKVLIPIRSLVKIILASVVIYFVSVNLHFPSILLPLNFIISGIIYLILLLFTHEITKVDIDILLSLIPEKIINKYGKR